MNRIWRTVLFAVFAAGFLISAPLVVLYTAGYRYQLGSMRVVKAGVLSLTSIPKGASVTIDSVLNNKQTPAVIDNLFPGDVKILVEKSGYSSWEKTLPIVSGESTFVPSAILFLNGTPTQSVDPTNIIAATPFDDATFAYLASSSTTNELFVHDGGFLQDRSLLKLPSHPKSTYTLSWSPDGQYLLLDEFSTKHSYTLIRSLDATTIALPTGTIAEMHFDVGSSHTILYHVGTEIRAFGIDADATFPKKLLVDDAEHKDGRLVAVQSADQSIVSYVDDANVASIIAYLPLGTYKFVPAPSPLLMLEETTRHHIILLDPTNQQPLLLNEEATLFQWSANQDRLAFSNSFDTKIFSRSSEQTDTITRFSDPLTTLAWYPLGDELVFSQDTHTYALELDRRDNRNIVDLIPDFTVQTLWISKDGSSLNFLGNKNGIAPTIYERKLQK